MEIAELTTLWEEVAQDAFSTCGNNLTATFKDGKKTLSSIYHETKQNIEKANKNKAAEFLVAPLLEAGLRELSRLYLLPMDEVISGEYLPKRERLEQLRKELAGSDAKIRWDSFAGELAESVRSAGMDLDLEQIRNISGICDVLLDAFSFLGEYATKIHRIRKGEDSGEKSVFLDIMPRFSGLAQFGDAFSEASYPCCIMFAMIAPTYRQTENSLWKWTNGREEERNWNLRKNCGMIDKDFESQTDLHRAQIAIGVKRGENIWIISHGSEVPSHGSFQLYSYYGSGKRYSYLPYQPFFKDAPEPEAECTSLAVPRKAYRISGLADAEQSLWIPALLWNIHQRFFAEPIDDDEECVHFGESAEVHILQMEEAVSQNLPVVRKTLDVEVDVMKVPDWACEFPLAERMIDVLKLTPADIAGAPIEPKGIVGSEEALYKQLWKNARYALCGAAARKLKVLYDDSIEEAMRLYVRCCAENKQFLLQELKNPESHVWKLSRSVVDGRQIINSRQQPVIEKTSADDGRRPWGLPRYKAFFPESLLGKRPPAYITITPETVEDLTLLCGLSYDKLPDILKLMELLKSHSWCWDTKEEKEKDPFFQLPSFLDLHRLSFELKLCMGKREFKQLTGDYPPISGSL